MGNYFGFVRCFCFRWSGGGGVFWTFNIIKEGFKVVPSSAKDIMLIYGHDKLVSLKKMDGSSALLFVNSEGDELSLDLRLHLPQGSRDFLVI
ncbi:MAG: hypothetical protein FWH36_06500 [Lentimicrobiaceae bacterium]|nr:hypothetical protein [Lentimicrobiaceae bacterium]